MEEKELLESWLLCSIKGIGPKGIKRLIEKAGSALAVQRLPGNIWMNLLGEKKAFLLVKEMDRTRRKNREKLFYNMKEKNIQFLPFWHEAFPERLKEIPDPPAALYLKGRLPDETKKSAAVIGARACSNYGRNTARYFAQGLAGAGVVIVSGMARGVDGIAGTAALNAGGYSAAVLGCGVDICYPEENRELYERLEREGGLISEYMPGTMPEAYLFPKRNRIISGLSDIVIVTEAGEKSGTLITVDMALEQGRDVFAVPGRIVDECSRGCNRLISNGAGAALDVKQLLEELGINRTESGKADEEGKTEACPKRNGGGKAKLCDTSGFLPKTNVQQRHMMERLLAALDSEPQSIDELKKSMEREAGCPEVSPSQLMHALMLLCMEEKAAGAGGMYYLL